MNVLPRRLYAYITLTVVLAALAVASALVQSAGYAYEPWNWYIAVILAPMVAVCLRFPLHVAAKTQQDMGAAPIMAAIILLPAPFALATCILGVLVGELSKSTRRPAQVAFNASKAILAIACARMAVELLGANGAGAHGLAGLAVPVVVYYGIDVVVSEGIVALQLHMAPFKGWMARAGEGARHEVALLVLGMFAGRVGESEAWTLPLMGIPCAVLYRSLHYQHVRLVRAEAGLAVAEDDRRRLIAIVETTPDFVATADPAGRMLYLNEAGRRMLGLDAGKGPPEIPLESAFPSWRREAAIAEADSQWTGESRVLRSGGGEIPVSQVILAHRGESGDTEFFSTVARDITEQKHLERQLQHLAHHDALTGLLNRRGFDALLNWSIDDAAHSGGMVALTIFDLDGFKRVNDIYGHEVGDRLLRGVASALSAVVVPEGGSLARLGGDEFAVVLTDSSPRHAREVAAAIVSAVGAFVLAVGSARVSVEASAGLACLHGGAGDAKELVVRADAAMYNAKKNRSGLVESEAA